MNSAEHFELLRLGGVIPLDSVILSTHNNLVVSSDSEGTVSRISTVDVMKRRKDPGDIFYSHYMSRHLGSSYGVVPPIDDKPIEFEGSVISRYPAMPSPNWSSISGSMLAEVVSRLNTFPYKSNPFTIPVRRMNIPQYAQDRLNYLHQHAASVPAIAESVQYLLNYYESEHSFRSAISQSEGLVHGDLHAKNVVLSGENGTPLFIDLDSIAIGPKEYDLASWCVRSMRGDAAPALEATSLVVSEGLASQDLIRSMIGWKAISSMTYELVYNSEDASEQVAELAGIAESLEAPGPWRECA